MEKHLFLCTEYLTWTGETIVHTQRKILVSKGQKQVGVATNGERGKNLTICCCVSVTGEYVLRMFIYPSHRMTITLERWSV